MGLFRSRRNLFRDRARERRRKCTVCAALAFALVLAATTWLFHDKAGNVSLAPHGEPLHELDGSAGEVDLVPAAVDGGLPLLDHAPRPEEAAPERNVQEGTISSGDTAAALLSPYLSPAQIHALGEACREVYPLSRLRAGQPYSITATEDRLERFEYEIDADSRLVVRPEGDGYAASREAIAYEMQTRIVAGKITSSLFGAVAEAGETPALAIRLADIFAWDIDFIRDIRVGDSFVAVVEKRSRDGQFAGYGRIVAARFVNQGQTFHGFLFDGGHGGEQYYDEQGKSLRKAFLKAPLHFSRISSGFNLNRLHPVLGYRRPHPAIDYAAPSGTPVKAVGDGVVLKRGWDRGGGNFIKIRHNSVYETVYMHLKGFAKGVANGARVRQGQVIGYVGSTGLSTGPHLDFRMKKNGSYIDPRTIKSPPADPVASERMAAYMGHIQPLLAQMHSAGLMHARADAPDVDVALR
ncbi:peptidoglycan DD-metalloendopeptidase family protein [Desulfocurvus sp.]|jgi:murein DD-endopeptidase MepM/ murein hydrolase activator NlpD|uniref:peptidoglycan DD-metalloendopeptidase family protein n=1 Tax=Desulfocurvus sp. TaxID=2871698 RepID=UPI0025C2A5C6|nr:peptidoglycan DD-metalloendopeptidase family protein [Desulfocurvus sp.]MCK9238858.1 peptidoglycan DD-metalloendopeptidase family protein [Desulfocurvus sp.]